MKHVRIFANLGFWKPCLVSKDISDGEIALIETLDSALSAAVPVIGAVISIQVTDGSQAPATTVADVHAAS